MKKRKISHVMRQSIRKLKYLDKTQSSYFMIMSFLVAFCLFTGGTYSYFTFSKNLNAATISIAKLNYTLTSTSQDFVDSKIVVGPGEEKVIEFSLNSLNNVATKYALKYSTLATNTKVYYSQNLTNNMSGIIEAHGSITLRVVIKNDGTSDATVNFTVDGGYIQNTLESNITEGYYEADITVRAVLLDENLSNGIIGQSFPPKDGEYGYVKTSCNEETAASWDSTAWKLNLVDITKKVSCDVYFKKMNNDIETIFVLEKKDGTSEYVTNVPNDGTYTFQSVTCSPNATATWDATNWRMNITGITSKTLCTGLFKEN